MGRSLVVAALALSVMVGCGAQNRSAVSRPVIQPLQPLRIWTTNPRYFTDGSGRAVLLTGFHTWANLVDRGTSSPPQAFDYGAYLDQLQHDGDNFMRLWAWELPEYRDHDRTFYTAPQPWERTGPRTARDGLPRFDLTRFDQAYFDRLGRRVAAAGQRGIYVSVMLFEGWEARFAQPPLRWADHPFAEGNNVNGIAVEQDHTGRRLDLFRLSDESAVALQRAYVRKVVDTVGRLPNVLFEISNEADAGSTPWQRSMLRLVRSELGRLDVSRPVGLTFQHDGSNDALYDSGADWVSPGGHRFLDDPPVADSSKVSVLDTDHVCGVCGDAGFVWASFTRGYNPILMDDLSASPALEGARVALGRVRELAGRIDLAHLRPRTDLSSTRYALARPGSEYVVYQPGSGPFTVDLPRRRRAYSVRWLSVADGQVVRGPVLRARERTTLTAPFAGPALLDLKAS